MVTLELQNVTCDYGHDPVLEELSLSVRAGEVLVLLGPNGSGKTTIMRALSRILKPSHGVVLVDNIDIWSRPRQVSARRTALAPQSEKRDWPLTVEQAVRMGRTPHRGWLMPFTDDDSRVVEEALEATGLESLRDRVITELSGGEWRRVVLARALAQQAQVLLLDEPTAGLDLKYQFELLKLVRRLSQDNDLTVILTLHDLNLASVYADRLAVIHDKSVVAVGHADDVLTEDLVRKVYDLPVKVIRHPIYGTPLVVPQLE